MEENNIDINHNNTNWICNDNTCEPCMRKKQILNNNISKTKRFKFLERFLPYFFF